MLVLTSLAVLWKGTNGSALQPESPCSTTAPLPSAGGTHLSPAPKLSVPLVKHILLYTSACASLTTVLKGSSKEHSLSISCQAFSTKRKQLAASPLLPKS